jgi:DNA-binding PadR family transcriptional regulator
MRIAPSLNSHLSRRYYTLTSKGLATSPEAIEWTNSLKTLLEKLRAMYETEA